MKKANSFEQFAKDFTVELKHGLYWHLSEKQDFDIDPTYCPRDLSSLATGVDEPGLMMSTDPENWSGYFPDRNYAALLDTSALARDEYYQVHRGFGNEFWVTDPCKVKVKAVVPVEKAIGINNWYHEEVLPQTKDELYELWKEVQDE